MKRFFVLLWTEMRLENDQGGERRRNGMMGRQLWLKACRMDHKSVGQWLSLHPVTMSWALSQYQAHESKMDAYRFRESIQVRCRVGMILNKSRVGQHIVSDFKLGSYPNSRIFPRSNNFHIWWAKNGFNLDSNYIFGITKFGLLSSS